MYDRADLALPDVFEDGLELVGRGWFLGDVQLEVDTMGNSLRRVVARLILGGGRGGVRRGLLQYGGSPERGRRAGLVEEGDNVESFVLFSAVSASPFIHGRVPGQCQSMDSTATYKSKHGDNRLVALETVG